MIRSHYDHYAGGKYHQHPCQGSFFQDSRSQKVVIQQGSGPYPYGEATGTTVVAQHGRPYFVALGVFFLVVSFVLLICGTLLVTGANGGIGKNLHEEHRDSWNFKQRNNAFKSHSESNVFHTPVVMSLFGFGGITFLAGLGFFMPSVRHEMKKNRQPLQMRTGDQTSTGADKPRQPYYQPSNQPSYQQGSDIPLQPIQPHSSYPLGSAIPPQYLQPNPSYQKGFAFPPQPFLPIPPSTDPPPYTREPVPYPKARFTSSAGPEMGYTKANWVL